MKKFKPGDSFLYKAEDGQERTGEIVFVYENEKTSSYLVSWDNMIGVFHLPENVVEKWEKVTFMNVRTKGNL